MKKLNKKKCVLIKKLNQCKTKLINCNLIKKYKLKNNKNQALSIHKVLTSRAKTKSFYNKFKLILKRRNLINKLSKNWKIRIKISLVKLIILNKKN